MPRRKLYIITPENILQRCVELENLNKGQDAIKIIIDFFSNKRTLTLCFNSIFEELLFKYIDLCLQNSVCPRTGLMRYKYLSNQAPNSQLYLRKAYNFLMESIENFKNIEVQDIKFNFKNDFEKYQSSSHKLHFLFKCLLNVLELVKYIPSIIDFYSAAAEMAFSFCREFKWKKEITILLENSKKDMFSLSKLQGVKECADFKDPSHLENFISVRYLFLRHYIDCNDFINVIKTIEEISLLTKQPRNGIKSFQPLLFLSFYELLIDLFWKTKNYILHANAYFQYVQICILSQQFDEFRLNKKKCHLALSIISIPPEKNVTLTEFEKRISNLFCLYDSTRSPILTRQELFFELEKFKDDVFGENFFIKEIQNLLDFPVENLKIGPEIFANNAKKLIKSLKTAKNYKKYQPLLKRNIIIKIIKYCQRIYTVMKIESLELLLGIPFDDFEHLIFDFFNFEVDWIRKIVIFSEENDLRDKIDLLSEELAKISDEIYPLIFGQDKFEEKLKNRRKSQFLLINKQLTIEQKLSSKPTEKITDFEKNKSKNDAENNSKIENDNKKLTEKESEKLKQKKAPKKKEKTREEKERIKRERKERIRTANEIAEEEKKNCLAFKSVPGCDAIPQCVNFAALLAKPKAFVVNFKKICFLKNSVAKAREDFVRDYFKKTCVDGDFIERAIRKEENEIWAENDALFIKKLKENMTNWIEQVEAKIDETSKIDDIAYSIDLIQNEHKILLKNQQKRKIEHDENRKKYLKILKEREKKRLEEAELAKKEEEEKLLQAKKDQRKEKNALLFGKGLNKTKTMQNLPQSIKSLSNESPSKSKFALKDDVIPRFGKLKTINNSIINQNSQKTTQNRQNLAKIDKNLTQNDKNLTNNDQKLSKFSNFGEIREKNEKSPKKSKFGFDENSPFFNRIKSKNENVSKKPISGKKSDIFGKNIAKNAKSDKNGKIEEKILTKKTKFGATQYSALDFD